MSRKYRALVYKLHLKPACIAAVTVFLLLMLEPSAVIASMQRSLRLCAGTVIPALFPYLVASELLVRSGAGERLAAWLSPPIRALFGVSAVGAVVYIMGILCGFPVAARTAAAYAKVGKLTREENEHLLCFCNVPSAAFVINAVGVSLYGDAVLGRVLWGLALLSAAIVGVLYRAICRLPRGVAPKEAVIPRETEAPNGGNSLASAVASAAGGMLSVVATVLFFGAVLGALTALLSHASGVYGAGEPFALSLLSALVACVFEMTGGVASAAGLMQTQEALLHAVSPLLCAAAVGWGGLSVHFQLLGAYDGVYPPLRLGRFFLSRLMQGCLCMLGIMIYLRWR